MITQFRSSELLKLYILHKLPTPYNDMFFHMIDCHDSIDLQVYHLWRGSWRRPWLSPLGQGYRNHYMHEVLGIDWNFLAKACFDTDSFFLIADWGHLTSLITILARYIRRAPVGIWADTPQEEIYRPAVKKWLRRRFLKWLLPKCDVIFGTGEVALRVLERMGARIEQLVNLPCFVDLDRPEKARRNPDICKRAADLRQMVGCKEHGVVFSINGTLVKKKGQDIGLRALAMCKQQSANPIGLLIAGEGPDRACLESLVSELDLRNSVRFLGWQEPEEMDAVYLASDVVLHPARYDPFPLVVLETMSWSKVLVGSDVCGSVEERIRHGVNGFSFPSENLQSLTCIMTMLINQPSLLQTIGSRARASAEEWPAVRGVEILRDNAQRILAANRQVKVRDRFDS